MLSFLAPDPSYTVMSSVAAKYLTGSLSKVIYRGLYYVHTNAYINFSLSFDSLLSNPELKIVENWCCSVCYEISRMLLGPWCQCQAQQYGDRGCINNLYVCWLSFKPSFIQLHDFSGLQIFLYKWENDGMWFISLTEMGDGLVLTAYRNHLTSSSKACCYHALSPM